ncbi:adenosine kinase [Acuticoccus sp. MNP-M23]|uniref:adenosine kinase n=1 Tax=Acuticoccus sp. MNP-M23 TaxID=3072793 RepID=UPI002815DD8E|nr:adenosine kinase [Acuticoccus sp. MNP-M23]WMS44808.1 adenosine kinase [Acuticoccus sp. MNP-M23]
MTDTRYDVLGIGNAIFDILGHVHEAALTDNGLEKGSMRLVTAEEALACDALLTEAVRISGGSAGNSIAGVASLGGRGAFIGKVATDTFGDAYASDMHRIGIEFSTPRLTDGTPTATSVILVTPDGERTMNTFLGASQHLTEGDIDTALVDASAITFLEGYLFDPAPAKAAFRTATERAAKVGRRAAVTLSDSFCIERHRADFMEWLSSGQVGIVLANTAEAKSLFETDDIELACKKLGDLVPLAAVTMGEKGVRVLDKGAATDVAAKPTKVVDLTGAGDLFAGGFLLGIARGIAPAAAAELGAIAAAEVISHVGARPQVDLNELAGAAGIALPAAA